MKRFHSFRLDSVNQCFWRGELRVPISAQPATRHATWVANLQPATEYAYRILVDESGGRKLTTSEQRFRTLAQ